MAYYGKYTAGADGDWVDLVALNAGLSAKVVLIQNRDNENEIFVVFGGTKPVNLDDGIELRQNQVIWGSGTAIWVRGSDGFSVAVQDKE